MDNVLDRNLKMLETHQPYVYGKLMAYLNGTYIPRNNSVERILLARQDDLIINMLVVCNGKEYLLCEHEDPISQSYAWIDKYIDPSVKAEIVFGMGFGFHLEVLLTTFKNKKVMVVEPNIELFYQVLRVRNLELIIRNSELCVDEEVEAILARVNALLWDTEKGGIQCQPFDVYGEMFEAEWESLRSKFIKHVQGFSIDIFTRRRFGELWIYNNIKNADRISEASNAGALKGKFCGVPGILVSAGPSLAKNVHLLKGLKNRCIIMAGGTAVNVLEHYGVTPHFMVGIDASEEETEIHRKVKSADIYFIYSNQVATGSVESYKGAKFVMNYPADVYTAEFFRFAGIESELYFSGPSVSNTCFDILFKMGCNPIILIGQDLAYTGGSLYAGEVYGSRVNASTGHEKEGYILLKDIYGNDIYTAPGFIAMRNWFEGYFEKVRNSVEIINATEGGLNIEFARNDTLSNVLSSYDFSVREIDERIRHIYETAHFPGDINVKLDEYKDFIRAEIRKLEEYSRKQMKLVKLISRDVYHPSKDKKSFDRMVGQVGELTDLVMSSPIFKSLLKNLVEIEFYLIKLEFERSAKGLNRYSEMKDIYVEALRKQNAILADKLGRIKEFLEN